MEYVIVILLIVLIFKEDIKAEIYYHKSNKQPIEKTKEEQQKEKRKEEFEQELNSIMDYSIDTAINSRKGR